MVRTGRGWSCSATTPATCARNCCVAIAPAITSASTAGAAQQDYTDFQRARPARYAELDAQGDTLTLDERHLGTFTAPDAG